MMRGRFQSDAPELRSEFGAISSEERSNRPPRSLVAFNKAIMKHGARLPLYLLVRRVLAHQGLSPSQLNPNACKIMAGMHIL